jgi:hypothetical protein
MYGTGSKNSHRKELRSLLKALQQNRENGARGRTDKSKKRKQLMLCTWKPVNTSELNKLASNSYNIQPHEALSNDATGCNHDGVVS